MLGGAVGRGALCAAAMLREGCQGEGENQEQASRGLRGRHLSVRGREGQTHSGAPATHWPGQLEPLAACVLKVSRTGEGRSEAAEGSGGRRARKEPSRLSRNPWGGKKDPGGERQGQGSL